MSSSDRLRVVHVAEDISAIAGGVPEVVRQLSQRLSLQDVSVNIIHALGNADRLFGDVETNCFPPSHIGAPWGWSPQLRHGMAQLTTLPKSTVFHLHGIWAAPQYIAAQTASEYSIPFVVSSHGMLEPWLWERQGWLVQAKKHAYWKMFAYPALCTASMIHAITPLEQQHLHALFPLNQIEVIPNAIDLAEYPDDDNVSHESQRTILFLGRVEPKKGVDILLRAFAGAKLNDDWRVVIIGPVWSLAYQSELEKIVAEHALGNRVSFLGPLFGKEKLGWLRKAWIMAVPSHSEVVGLVNLESSAMFTPSITTHETGLFDWESGGGLLIHPNVDQMRLALEQACSWSVSERAERGRASRRLVSERYSWEAVLPQWMSLYDSLIVKG